MSQEGLNKAAKTQNNIIYKDWEAKMVNVGSLHVCDLSFKCISPYYYNSLQ